MLPCRKETVPPVVAPVYIRPIYSPEVVVNSNAAIHAAIVARATKASGVIVRVTPADFLAILDRATAPVVVVATGGVFVTHTQYMTSYKGFAFFTKSKEPFLLPKGVETIVAEKIWIPD